MNLKKFIVAVLICSVAAFAAACGGNNNEIPVTDEATGTIETNSEENENTEEITDSENKSSNKNTSASESDSALGETVTVSTEHGDFEITIVGAVWTDWNEEGDYKSVSIRSEINNINYDEWEDGEGINAFYLDTNGYIKVLDEEGFSLEHYDLTGAPEGQYGVGENVHIGEKARLSLPYMVHKDATSVTVVINNEHTIVVPIE